MEKIIEGEIVEARPVEKSPDVWVVVCEYSADAHPGGIVYGRDRNKAEEFIAERRLLAPELGTHLVRVVLPVKESK